MSTDPTQGGPGRATFVFGASFPGFDGHFPRDAILPGVCVVQALHVAAEAWAGRPLTLRRIASAKFLSAVRPGETLELTWQERPLDATAFVAVGAASCEGRRVADLRLELASG